MNTNNFDIGKSLINELKEKVSLSLISNKNVEFISNVTKLKELIKGDLILHKAKVCEFNSFKLKILQELKQSIVRASSAMIKTSKTPKKRNKKKKSSVLPEYSTLESKTETSTKKLSVLSFKSTPSTTYNRPIRQRFITGQNQKSILTLKASNINWFRIRQPKEFIERSVNTLLPNNGETDVSNLSTAKKFISKLENELKERTKIYSKPKIIAPEYFFSRKMIKRIEKLRDIFLEFDKDFSRKLEINELYDMFKTNNIPVEMEDLLSLFFKNQVLKKDEEPCLNFFQLIEFAFNQENELLFEQFVRKVKAMFIQQHLNDEVGHQTSKSESNHKTEESHLKLGTNKAQDNDQNQIANSRIRSISLCYRSALSNIEEVSIEEFNQESFSSKSKEVEKISKGCNSQSMNSNIQTKLSKLIEPKNNIYLPMSLNLLLDFLNKKGSIRMDYDEIHEVVKLIEDFNNENKELEITSAHRLKDVGIDHDKINIEIVYEKFRDIINRFSAVKNEIKADNSLSSISQEEESSSITNKKRMSINVENYKFKQQPEKEELINLNLFEKKVNSSKNLNAISLQKDEYSSSGGIPIKPSIKESVQLISLLTNSEVNASDSLNNKLKIKKGGVVFKSELEHEMKINSDVNNFTKIKPQLGPRIFEVLPYQQKPEGSKLHGQNQNSLKKVINQRKVMLDQLNKECNEVRKIIHHKPVKPVKSVKIHDLNNKSAIPSKYRTIEQSNINSPNFADTIILSSTNRGISFNKFCLSKTISTKNSTAPTIQNKTFHLASKNFLPGLNL